jgi:predicted RNA-binding Zn-ribbon protein involved in translation (DUF1610 family)
MLRELRLWLARRADRRNVRKVPYYCPHCGRELVLNFIGCTFDPRTGQRVNVSANFQCPRWDLNPGHFRREVKLRSNPSENWIRAWWGAVR